MYRRKTYSFSPELAWKLSPSFAGFTINRQFSRTIQSFDPSRAQRSTDAIQRTATATTAIPWRDFVRFAVPNSEVENLRHIILTISRAAKLRSQRGHYPG